MTTPFCSRGASRRTGLHQRVSRQPGVPVSRRGRLLVECLVAMLLLNATALVAVSLSRSAGSSTERAGMVTAAWAMAARHLEAPAPTDSVCTAPASAPADVVGRVRGTWHDHPNAGWGERALIVTMTPSPLLGVPSQLDTRAAWSCP